MVQVRRCPWCGERFGGRLASLRLALHRRRHSGDPPRVRKLPGAHVAGTESPR